MIDKYQIFIFLIAVIPVANIFFVKIKSDNLNLCRNFNLLFPKLFCFILFGISLLQGEKTITVEFFRFFSLNSFAFSITKLSLIFLTFLGLFWLVFSIYAQKLLSILVINSKFYDYFLLIILTLCFLFLSKNLITILVFYQILVIIFHFFSSDFLYKKDNKNLTFFTLLFFLQTIFLFLAIIITLKILGKSNFDQVPSLLNKLTTSKFLPLLFLYLSTSFLLIIAPFYLFYQKIKLNPIFIFTVFFLLYAVSNCYILFKVFIDVFDVFSFSLRFLEDYFIFFEGVALFNIIISSLFLIFSNNFKSSFFYFFLQQLSFAFFCTFLFLIYKIDKLFLPFLSFSISFILLFFCISNIALYFENNLQNKIKNESKIFSLNIKKNMVLLFLAILSIAKIFPSISLFEGFFILKIIREESLILSAIICFIGFVSIIIFAIKIIYLFPHCKNNQKTINTNLRNFNSGLAFIISPLLVLFILVLSPILLIYF